jgi:predicted ferric reductase
VREASHFSIRIPVKGRIFSLPTVGRASLILGNIVVILVLCFYGFDVNDRWSREDIGYRCGFVAIGQLPLIFLLAGKNNIVGYLTGISYERINWLHRWCARCLLLTTTIHMGYFFADWAPYDYIGVQLKENTLVWKGVAAWAVLVWIVFSSMTPIRGWSYEVFVLQHLVSFAVLIGFVYIHTPAEVHVYIWVSVALFFFDRFVRLLRVLYANISFFHPKQRRSGEMSGLWACKAEFTPLSNKTTRIVIRNPPISWTPGQHVFLSCQSVVPLQNHPFTIASIPADGKMEFLVKAESGGTKRFFRHAEQTHGPLAPSPRSCTRTVAIEGPYGCIRPLRQFDSVVLLAGSTGATFTIPLLRDILQGWKENASPGRNAASLFRPQTGAATRHVRFVWVVRSRGQLAFFSEQLAAASSDFQTLQDELKHIKLELTVYLTCDESFTEEHRTFMSKISAPDPNFTSKTPKDTQHGAVEFRSRTPSLNEKQKMDDSKEEVKELGDSCEPSGTCCCKTTVDETLSPDTISSPCCCGASKAENTSVRRIARSSLAPSTSSQEKPLLHPSIQVFSGRPNPREIIRRSLEQALGESAVVVCGPRGLISDVKNDVCSLSDERAVHKGTGAQGIYLHTESFGY